VVSSRACTAALAGSYICIRVSPVAGDPVRPGICTPIPLVARVRMLYRSYPPHPESVRSCAYQLNFFQFLSAPEAPEARNLYCCPNASPLRLAHESSYHKSWTRLPGQIILATRNLYGPARDLYGQRPESVRQIPGFPPAHARKMYVVALPSICFHELFT